MKLQLTDFAVSQLDASTGPIALDLFRLGSAVDYVPLSTDTDIHGSLVYTGAVSPATAENANIIKYSCYLDYNVGDFYFGEVALMYQGQLFALGVDSQLTHKIRSGTTLGNAIRIDVYLSVNGTNYGMWVDLAESDNKFQVASLSTVDQIPPSASAQPNVYIITGADTTQSAFFAYTDRLGLWAFDTYQYATISHATITATDYQSVTISSADFSADATPGYFGEVILQFTTGRLYSICRYVKTAVVSGSTVTLGFDTSIAMLPVAGDKIVLVKRNPLATAPQLPIATASTLGGVKIGSGLLVTGDGTVSVDAASIGTVLSVNGKTGIVSLTPSDIPGLATVASTGQYSDLLGTPAPYALPPMSTTVRGGARLPANNNLIVLSGDVLDLGFAPVKTVNGLSPDGSGNVSLTSSIIGLVNPTVVPASDNFNNYTNAGIFTVTAAVAPTLLNAPINNAQFTLEVVPLTTTGSGESVQRVTSDSLAYWRKGSGTTWSSWQQVATNVIATASTLGVVRIGSGLNIDGTGLLTSRLASTTVTGVVRVGTGLSVDGTGLLTLNAPIATTTTLGEVIIGAGLAVDGAGVVSVNAATLPVATISSLGVMQVGFGLLVTAGGVVSVDTAGLAAATGSTAGVVKVGTGILVAGDGTISLDYSSLPVATTTTLGVMKVGSGLSVAAGLVSANLRTVNGLSPDGSGDIAIPADSSKLDRVNGVAVGIQLAFSDLGTVSAGGTVAVTTTTANVMAATFIGGAVTWTLSGWPATGTYAEVQIEVINGGLATHTFPAAVQWVNPDGTTTSTFATYIGNQRSGATNFQTSGTDFAIFWTRDGGTTVYARVM